MVFIFFSIFYIGKGFSQQLDSLCYNIINSFASPGPSPWGLAWDGSFLWVADDSTDTLYKLNPVDGLIISSFQTPGPEPRGLTWDGTQLWCLDNNSLKIFKIDTTKRAAISSLPAPGSQTNRPVGGLTWDGQYLWSAYFAGWSSRVNQVDTTDGTVIETSLYSADGLAFDGEYLWNADYQEGYGFIDKRDFSGRWLAYTRTPGYYPTGLAYDGNYFWLADCGTDTIYQIEIISSHVEDLFNDKYFPISFRLDQNYPNPFNPETTISYCLPTSDYVTIKIYNITGREIRTLVNERKASGYYNIQWDGKDNNGTNVASGVYIYPK